MPAGTRSLVPAHILVRGRKYAGCEHLHAEDDASMEQLLRRYAAGLRWGQRLLSGKIRPQDGAEEEEERDKKRQKVCGCMLYLTTKA